MTTMDFFGMTTLGNADPVRDKTAPSQRYVFHELSNDDYLDAFNKYLLGDSSISRTLEVDGATHVLRASLGDMLRELLGRSPAKAELDAWFTALDFDRSALLDIDEFMQGVARLVSFSGNPQAPVAFKSTTAFRDAWTRHARVDYELQNTLNSPMTNNQEIGWHSLKPWPKNREHNTRPSTDVTKNEGRNAASYYGHLVCGNYDRRSRAI